MVKEKKPVAGTTEKKGFFVKALDLVEWLGNKLPDPAVLFLIGLIGTWFLSYFIAGDYTVVINDKEEQVAVTNMLTLDKFADFLSNMVEDFTGFHPLGVVLVALLGVGVADHSGFINTCLKSLMNITPDVLLTPMLILVAIMSHSAADAGYVLVIPIGGVMFYAAGRHPLAGIAAAFAGVSGGFSANFIPSGLDPLLSSLTQEGAAVADPDYTVNPLCNYYFTTVSSVLIVAVGWFLTDKIVEPRLRSTEIDGNPDEIPKIEEATASDLRGMWMGLGSIVLSLVLLAAWAWPQDSALRDADGNLTSYTIKRNDFGIELDPESKDTAVVKYLTNRGPSDEAGLQRGDTILKINEDDIDSLDSYDQFARAANPNAESVFTIVRNGEEKTLAIKPEAEKLPGSSLMRMIVPLIFLIFVIPGLVHGFVSGKFSSHRDVVKGMSKTMETMGYYLVLVFFAALFIKAFTSSGIGQLFAIKGANFIKASDADPWLVILGIILLTGMVNLLIGSASAKWAMLSPVFVPMLMYLGFSPELTQAAYRVGDSTTNIITPMMPYFPLVVVFCQRYVKDTGIGTVAAMMLPYSICFLACWAVFLLAYWGLGFPLGLQAPYEYVLPEPVQAATDAAASLP